MKTIRPIEVADVPAVATFAEAALRGVMELEHTPLIVDPQRIDSAVRFFASAPPEQAFNLASFDADGSVVAALAVYIQPMFFFERNEAVVAFCFSEEAGEGMRMVRQFMEFFQSRMDLRRVVWAMNQSTERMQEMLRRRFYFKTELATLVHYKGF